MVELGTRRTTERVRDGNSPPTVERAVFLPDHLDRLSENAKSEKFGIDNKELMT